MVRGYQGARQGRREVSMIPNEDSLRDRYDRVASQPLSEDTQDHIRSIEARLEAERQRELEENDDFIEKLFGVR